jgi:small-conductance mechanosensitive channel
MKSLEIHLKQLFPGEIGRLILDGISSLVVVAILLFAYFWISRGLTTLAKYGGLSTQAARVLKQIAGWTLITLGTLLSMQQFGLISNVWTTLGALMALVGVGFIAVWSVLSNSFCSIVLMVTKPFSAGDWIEIPGEDVRGKVVDFNLVFTTLLDRDGGYAQIPNNIFLQKSCRRYIGNDTRELNVQADREGPLQSHDEVAVDGMPSTR